MRCWCPATGTAGGSPGCFWKGWVRLSGLCRQSGGSAPHLAPLTRRSQAATAPCQGPTCQPIFGMQVVTTGTELWRGVRSGGGRCVSEEALLLCHADLGGGGGDLKKVIILLLHLPVCPSSCCPPRTPDGGLSLALGVPRVSTTAHLAWDWSTVL